MLPGIMSELKKYEVVTPKQCMGNNTKEVIIQTTQEIFHIELKENQVITTDSFSVTITSNGKRQKYKQTKGIVNCHYHGSLKNGEGKVVMSLCNGLSGSIHTKGDKMYFIEPLGKENKHIFYNREDLITKKLHYNNAMEDSNLKIVKNLNKKRKRRDLSAEIKYVPLAMVVDHTLYTIFNSDSAAVTTYVLSAVNYMNHMFNMVNLHIALTNLEIWSDQDKMLVSSTNAFTTLSNFHNYHRDVLIQGNNWRDHHNAHLLSGVQLGGLAGLALTGTLCQSQSEAMSVAWSFNPYSVAGSISHELAHNMGIGHDSTNCNCPGNDCLMSPYVSTLVDAWSNCSVAKLNERREGGYLSCLTDVPNQVFSDHCGNGFVEEDEECDCGPHDLCTNQCCNPTTCKLAAHAQCAHGTCCNTLTCSFVPAGTTCRNSAGECDLVDKCSGDKGDCPDVTIPDFYPCNNNKNSCNQGKCARTQNEQCKYLWGNNAKWNKNTCVPTASLTNPNEFANCGQSMDGSYLACQTSDLPCGRIHCHGNNLPTFPLLGTSRRVSIYSDGQKTCKTVTMFVYDKESPTYPQDGAKCNDNLDKVCYQHRCRNRNDLTFPKCHDLCKSGQGVCTNQGVCYCFATFGGLDCSQHDAGNIYGKPYYPCDGKCKNGGTCVNGKCVCPAGRSCPHCKNIDPLNLSTQSCSNSVDSGFHCDEYAFGGSFTSVGCKQKIPQHDPDFELIGNFRNQIDWRNFDSFTRRILCECAELAKTGGFKIFGIQFWGECWASRSNSTTASSSVNDCCNTAYQVCTHGDCKCVGKDDGIYMYRLTK